MPLRAIEVGVLCYGRKSATKQIHRTNVILTALDHMKRASGVKTVNSMHEKAGRLWDSI